MSINESKIYDVVGIGFGPSNLSLAIALSEHPVDFTYAFLERSSSTSWHQGMLLPGARMQVAFLKDLATFRNPTSRYSFVSYLYDSGRLAQFVNDCDFFPSRKDFHTYLEWAETDFADHVQRTTEVTDIAVEGDLAQIRVKRLDDGFAPEQIRARNVVISTGLVPRMPDGVFVGRSIWHSAQFLHQLSTYGSPVRRVGVIGGGQSAAEIVRHLYDELSDAQIYAIVPTFGYSVADGTPFVNHVFDPAAMDAYYSSTEQGKRAIWVNHKNTNYSVVDEDLIRDLHHRAYDDEIGGAKRLQVLNMTRVLGAEQHQNGTRVTVRSTLDDSTNELDLDVLVCATGYRPMDPGAVLGAIGHHCRRDRLGRYVVGRDHRLTTSAEVPFGVYLQGGTEHTHGLSSSLLSNIAVRSGEIVDSIATKQGATNEH